MSGQRRSNSRLWLAAAYGWAVVCGIAVFTIPAARTSTIPQVHQTLFVHSHGAVALGALLMGSVLIVATVELVWRYRGNRAARGSATTVYASVVIAFSVFGFIFGILSIGLVALFALLSAKSFKEFATPVADPLFPISQGPS